MTLLIVSERHPAGFPLRDLGGPAVQRVAKKRCREPAAIDAFVATARGAACELARVGPVGECCAWTRYRSAETTQSDYGRHLASVRMIVLFVPHAAG
jgi:hypothetical protein